MCKKEYNEEKLNEMSDMIKRLRKGKQQDQAFKSNWEVDDYYDRRLKQYDQEKWI